MAQQIKKKFLSPEVINYFDDQINAVESSISTEQSRAESAEQALDAKIDQEVLDRQSGDQSTLTSANEYSDSKVLEEKGLRESGDAALDSRITTLEGQVGEDLQAAITQIQSDISSEASAREAADSVLDGRITSLEGQVGEDLQQAITDLEASIASEASSREAADANLQSQITTEKERVDAILSASQADKDSFAEIVQLINSVDTENDSAFAGYVLSNNAALAQEVSDRQSGDASTLQDAKDYTDAKETSLDERIQPIENREMFKKYSLYNDSAAVYSNGKAGVEDPFAITRDGWYFQNTSSSDIIGWYFYDKNSSFSPSIAKSEFSAFAVMTFDAVGTNGAKPIFGVYSYPTGTNDAYPGYFHSRWSYQMSQATLDSMVAGKKVLLYIGQNPEAHPELEHHELELVPFASLGEKLDTETIGFASFNSDTTTVNKVKWLVESLGVESEQYKQESSLKIRHAVKSVIEASLASEVSARQAAITSVESSVTTLEGVVQGNFDLQQSDIDLLRSDVEANSSSISNEQQSRENADTELSNRISVLEAQTDGPSFSNEKITVGANLEYVELAVECIKIMSCAVGRMAVHEGEDFTVSVVGGKTRLTWIGSLLHPGGEEAIETGDNVFVVYAH